MLHLVVIIGLLASVSSKPCGTAESKRELLTSLNMNLLRSVDNPGLPNPSIHLALRLSNYHSLAKEAEYLNKLNNQLHNDIQSSITNSQPVTGILALYGLALRSSCYDLTTITFTVGDHSENLLTHLKNQMEQEKEHIVVNRRPLTNYYQYSLGLLSLCVSSIKVHNHVSHKVIVAADKNDFKLGETESIDTYAMAGMALQCEKDSGLYMGNFTELNIALSEIKKKILDSRRPDGHMGNEFSTGLAVQALLAMGSDVADCADSMVAMRTAARNNVYHNPMAISQMLPALQKTSYLTLKSKQCLNESDSLVLASTNPTVPVPSSINVHVIVKVVTSSKAEVVYSVDVPKGSSLLEALNLLKTKNVGFTFELEPSLWGPFLSSVDGEQARQSDRRYWHLSSDGTALTEGVSDFKIEVAQKIRIENTSY
ncbi:transcobalamin-2 [Nematolebias whitei]|uniref:transcobalamin-2 n=1 Tax=Nematolebias whitei TaxID=451745 RepID=UPI0018999282|nr:transcobalamin-2 [Nematolebias whitei]